MTRRESTVVNKKPGFHVVPTLLLARNHYNMLPAQYSVSSTLYEESDVFRKEMRDAMKSVKSRIMGRRLAQLAKVEPKPKTTIIKIEN